MIVSSLMLALQATALPTSRRIRKHGKRTDSADTVIRLARARLKNSGWGYRLILICLEEPSNAAQQ
jgi:hypothetical protein